MTELELTELRAELVRRLRAHDWDFQYSDDPGSYHRGLETQKWLATTVRQLPDGVQLWNAYAPVGRKLTSGAA